MTQQRAEVVKTLEQGKDAQLSYLYVAAVD